MSVEMLEMFDRKLIAAKTLGERSPRTMIGKCGRELLGGTDRRFAMCNDGNFISVRAFF